MVGTGFTILCVVLGGLMAYAYMNGGVQRSLQDHERRIDANERKIADLERQQRGLSNTR